MAIRQLDAICWLLLGPEHPGDGGFGVHYPDLQEAGWAANLINAGGGDVEPAHLMEPCWVAVCAHDVALPDVCGMPLHSVTPGGLLRPDYEVMRQLRTRRWTISAAGIVHCGPLAAGDPAPGRDSIDMSDFEAGLRFTAREPEAE